MCAKSRFGFLYDINVHLSSKKLGTKTPTMCCVNIALSGSYLNSKFHWFGHHFHINFRLEDHDNRYE